MLLLFARFSDLYGELAKAKGLEIYREDKFGNLSTEFTREFQLWAMKLDDIDLESFKRGVENLEKRIEENSKNNEKSWPPNYCEFKGMCHKSAVKAMHRTWKGLPSPQMSNEDKKGKMAELRKNMGL